MPKVEQDQSPKGDPTEIITLVLLVIQIVSEWLRWYLAIR